MIKNPSDRLVPANTKLPEHAFKILPEVIERKQRELRRADIETSLWLMDELPHLRSLLSFNIEARATARISLVVESGEVFDLPVLAAYRKLNGDKRLRLLILRTDLKFLDSTTYVYDGTTILKFQNMTRKSINSSCMAAAEGQGFRGWRGASCVRATTDEVLAGVRGKTFIIDV